MAATASIRFRLCVQRKRTGVNSQASANQAIVTGFRPQASAQKPSAMYPQTAPKLYDIPARLAHRAAGNPSFAASEATYGGTQLEIPHQASVVVVDIKNAAIVYLRILGSRRTSLKVKRVKRPSRRCRFDSTHCSGSAMWRRIHHVRSAGRIPMMYIQRHADGPRPPTKSQMAEAMKNPIPSPHCMSPAPLPRCLAGHISAIIAVPVPHSDPRARPTTKRKARKELQSQARPVSPVVNE